MSEPTVKCPRCGHQFPVTKALTGQIEESLRYEYDTQARAQEKTLKAEYDRRITAEREKAEKTARATYAEQLAADKQRLQREADKKAQTSVSTELANLRRQLRKSEDTVREVQKREAAVQKREKLLNVKEQDIQKQIACAVEVTRKKTQQETSERIEREYHTRELLHQRDISDLKKQLTEMRRKLEQSSQQAQGEVVELELEKALVAAFPDDAIRRIGSGKLGADVIHKVVSPNGQCCGTIVWESKNTKNWNKSWLTKLRSDQRREKAEIAVIVSSVLPKDLRSHFAQVSGVWVTDFSVVAPLATALRANLIELARFRMSDQGKSEKMAVLYHYLMSTEFKQRVEAIVEAFATMRDDLNKEKQVTEKGWAKREKHLDLVLQNVSGMVGDIQAITPAFPRIKRLELPVSRFVGVNS